MEHLEKLGAFFLGRQYDLQAGKILPQPVVYDARDLTTHAVCVGMTGSGKTGLCIDLLEEAALDGVPAIVIDPKGDITNLLLNFPNLQPEDFAPWVNLDDARRKGMAPPEYARSVAKMWRKGLADWGQGTERMRQLQQSAEFRIFTPGSDAGLPVSIMASLRAPKLSWDEEAELIREQIQGRVSALLGLAGVATDQLQSREQILLSTIFEHHWRNGEDLDLGRLIQSIQNPPVRKMGVFDVDTFFPAKDRFGLAMALNNIMANPSFGVWLQGEPLDIASMLYGPGGKPRISIFTISHLADAERMFFVTLLLEQLTAWVRQQSGTTSLRALLYFDEVFGFLPPVANPPSKRPLLTLLKQARAFGLGVTLATQNPADLDYKSLTNAGTWFVGKLQAERDKKRLLDGLESIGGGDGPDRGELDRIISSLGSRVFLLHNVHEQRPVVMHTRWAMSYLRGPLTRKQIRQLRETGLASGAPTPAVSPAEAGPVVTAGSPAVAGVARSAAALGGTVSARAVTAPASGAAEDVSGPIQTKSAAAPGEPPPGYSTSAPAVPPAVDQVFVPVQMTASGAVSRLAEQGGRQIEPTSSLLMYEPRLLVLGRVGFVDRRRKVEESRQLGYMVSPEDLDTVVAWSDSEPVALDPKVLMSKPESQAVFGDMPGELSNAAKLKELAKEFSDYLYHDQRLELLHCPALKLYSEPGEPENEFLARAKHIAREKRDVEVDKLRRSFERKLDRLETRLAREERELDEDRADYAARKREEVISAGETIIGMLGVFGRKRSRGLSTAARKRRMTAKAKEDIHESEQEIARVTDEIEEMRRLMEEDAATIAEKWDATLDNIDTFPIKPRRSDVRVDLVALAWVPYWAVVYEAATGQSVQDVVQAGGLPG